MWGQPCTPRCGLSSCWTVGLRRRGNGGAVKDLGVVAWSRVPKAVAGGGSWRGRKRAPAWCGRGGIGEGPGREGTISTWSKWVSRACRCIPKQHKGALVCAWVRGWVLQGFSCLPRGRTGEEGTLMLCCPNATSTLPHSNQATRARHNLGTGTRRASTSRGPLPVCSNAHVGGSTARTRNRRRAWRGECTRIGAREHAEWCSDAVLSSKRPGAKGICGIC